MSLMSTSRFRLTAVSWVQGCSAAAGNDEDDDDHDEGVDDDDDEVCAELFDDGACEEHSLRLTR